MNQGPDPRAAVRGFMALVLDMVRVDPDRRPSAQMQRWHRDLATRLGVTIDAPATTNRALMDAALHLSDVANGLTAPAAPRPAPEVAAAA